MKLLLPLFLLATFCIGVTRQTLAQDKGHDGKPTVTIDGKTIDSDASRQEIEKWAEQHAREWEKWGERLEQKMERWAQQQEKQWEGWAEQYSRQWEEWGSKLEAGEIDSQQMNELLDKNLKMLKEMPLDRLIDGALKESLGELKTRLAGKPGRTQRTCRWSSGTIAEGNGKRNFQRCRIGTARQAEPAQDRGFERGT